MTAESSSQHLIPISAFPISAFQFFKENPLPGTTLTLGLRFEIVLNVLPFEVCILCFASSAPAPSPAALAGQSAAILPTFSTPRSGLEERRVSMGQSLQKAASQTRFAKGRTRRGEPPKKILSPIFPAFYVGLLPL